MADISDKIKEILTRLPQEPGVYLMHDASGSIIYIGKANSLKKRVSSYFMKKDHDPKTSILVKNISDIEYIVTGTEIEALILESNLIKKHKPKFNVRLKDDKRYPYIAVTMNEEYPRVIYTRSINRGKDRYFGPFTDAKAAKSTAAMINSLFKLKTCRRPLPLKENERPCINYQIKKCSGVCRGTISKEEYRSLIDNAISFLEGDIEPVIDNLNKKMQQYSSEMDYENAASIRDIIFDIQKISQSQSVDIQSISDQDCIACGIFGGEALVVLFEFRHGILTGRKISVFDNAEYTTPDDVIRTFILEYYADRDIPSRIVTEQQIQDSPLIAQHLSGKSGNKVSIAVVRSDEERGILNMIRKNIDILAVERKSSEAADPAIALTELKEALSLDSEPEVMVCFDISNTGGSESVASMVQFRLGRPDKNGYRRFKIRGYQGPNDPGMIHEAVSRRIQHIVNENLEFPDLIVIDGGPTQLSRAIEAAANFDADVKIVSLAKRLEEIYVSPTEPPVCLPEGSPPLKLMQNIRDEAHRFAITYHRKLRDKKFTGSELDSIPEIGEKTRKALLKHFRSVDNLASADIDEIMEVEGIGEKTAMKIFSYFNREEEE
ncbi:MAG TPA: excinuclease ABC subunit UvrC [Spirochaetota bacterium]|nr:excinuclease ABC subunit UvrC [Spirochaetota bacterium]HPJ35953.1 excinuclease ABC subunit UvrC [Spirochaetota bacterium]